jgi:hypothetical protein
MRFSLLDKQYAHSKIFKNKFFLHEGIVVKLVPNKDYTGKYRDKISWYKASGRQVFSVQAHPIFFGAVKEVAEDVFQDALRLPPRKISHLIAEAQEVK